MESGILSTIGHTPCIRLSKLFDETPCRWYGKLEMFNPGGSIKDRPAFRMINEALQSGEINETSTVIESSSGNTAVGLAQVCQYFNLRLIVVVDPKINGHTRQILHAFGARVDEVTEADKKGNYLSARLWRVKDLLAEVPNSYWPNQYTNRANPVSHYQTMKEIVEALPRPPDYLLAATSTCGTIMGCANYVQQHGLNTKMVAVDAVGSVIFGMPAADRLVPGYGAGRPSDLLQRSAIDHVIHITDKECVAGCRRLLQREAILAGGSSGAVVMAAERLQSEIPGGSTCVLILPDSGERYLQTIYNDAWVTKNFGDLDQPDKAIHSASLFNESDKNKIKKEGHQSDLAPARIAIIGGGPKGMYAFERLAAQCAAHPPDRNVEIHVFDKSGHPGAGSIYQPNQPSCLLTNNPVGDITMWIDEDPPPVVTEPLSLTAWLQKRQNKNVIETSYVSRADVGRYLEHGFADIAQNLPAAIRGKYFAAEVTDIEQTDLKYRLTAKSGGSRFHTLPHLYDHILLATGHPRNAAGATEKACRQFAGQNDKVRFVPFIYPVESALDPIPPGCHVGIKGIGLTFVDAVLALTEGRGGTFKPFPDASGLKYESSGKEPEIIYPFSRGGLPMVPRSPAPKDALSLKFFTRPTLERVRAKFAKIDFKEDLWPLLKQEMIYAFYEVKLRKICFKDDLSGCGTFNEVQHYIDAFHRKNPQADRFKPAHILKPLQNKTFDNPGAFNKYIQSYFDFFIAEAQRGETQSPWAAVTAVWRKATPVFGSFYAFGGLMPGSQRYFDTQFRRLLNRLSFGPPVQSMQKIAALMEAGILNFGMAQNPQVIMEAKEDAFVLKSEKYDTGQAFQCLVDARIPKVSLPDDRAPLYKNLLDRGLIALFKNESEHDLYQPGCIAISPEGFVMNKHGIVDRGIAVTGTPTEGVTFDNDALSRTRNNFVSDWAAFVRKSLIKSMVNVSA